MCGYETIAGYGMIAAYSYVLGTLSASRALSPNEPDRGAEIVAGATLLLVLGVGFWCSIVWGLCWFSHVGE